MRAESGIHQRANGRVRVLPERRARLMSLPPAAMTPEEQHNVELALRYVEACNFGTDEAVEECWAPEGVAAWFPGGGPAPETGAAAAPPAFGEAADRMLTIRNIMAAGESVAAAASVDGDGTPPAGVILVWRFRDGLIVSEHIYGE